MSLPAWITFFILAAAVFIHAMTVKDTRFLLFAIPALLAILLIPMLLAWMSRRALNESAEEHGDKARRYKIANITLAMTGQVVSISGEVRKVSFKWLGRPHFQIDDGTGKVRAILFAMPGETINPGDEVEVLGVVIKNIFDRRNAAISAVRIRKANA